MEEPPLRQIIRTKLADGRLTRVPIRRISGGISRGEQCVVCEETVAKPGLVIEAYMVSGSPAVHFHLLCFYLLSAEQQA